MTDRDQYTPGPATGAEVRSGLMGLRRTVGWDIKDGDAVAAAIGNDQAAAVG